MYEIALCVFLFQVLAGWVAFGFLMCLVVWWLRRDVRGGSK